MIVHHKAGEFVSGLMSRQYRMPFNIAGTASAGVAGGVLALTVGGPLDWAIPAGTLAVVYGMNLRGRFAKIRPYALKKPDRNVEDEILELQDIYFHMPKEHRGEIEKLLNAAYQQIERGNPGGVQPRVQAARGFRENVIAYNVKIDGQEDIKEVHSAARAMHLALEPPKLADPPPAVQKTAPAEGEVIDGTGFRDRMRRVRDHA